MRVINISTKVKCYMKIHRKHIGKTIVLHNLHKDNHVAMAAILRKGVIWEVTGTGSSFITDDL